MSQAHARSDGGRAAGSHLRWLFLVCAASAAVVSAAPAVRRNAPPNIVLIFCDDLGYADVGCFGAQGLATPNLDRLAQEGMRFTDFYAAQAVCSASRAALMTGCYPNRVSLYGALGPQSPLGLHPNEITLAEILKPRGYATAIYGKWHLGRPAEFLPRQQGFDDYFGLPYSNDMWPRHPETTNYPPLPLIAGDTVAQLMPDQTQLTTWYTERAVQFIGQHRTQPFFLYLAHNMPHVPLFVSDKFKGQSPRGLYGDVILEIDWSVGEILKALKRHQLDEQTLVIFTSDNGPWLLYGDHAGSARPLREGKATSFDGGQRVPCLMRWPGTIPAGRVCREVAATIDLLPTLAKLAGTEAPRDRVIDGKDLGPLMSGQPGARSPHEAFFFYWSRHLQAVRSGPWKLHFPHAYPRPNPPGGGGKPGKYETQQTELALFHLDQDIHETNNVAAQHPDVVERLQALAEKGRDDLGDSAAQRTGRDVRPPGRFRNSRDAAIPPLEGVTTLFASEATVHGSDLRCDTAQLALVSWSGTNAWASWDFTVPAAGPFLVEVVQRCEPGRGGGAVELDFSPQSLLLKVEQTAGSQGFRSRHIGQVTFEQGGRHTLSVRPKAVAGCPGFALRTVTLWPVRK